MLSATISRPTVALFLVTLFSSLAHPHSSIDGVGAKRLLAQLDQAAAIVDKTPKTPKAAAAWLELGEALQRIISIANSDRAKHGEQLSPASRYLLEQLRQRELDVEFSPDLDRYRQHTDSFQRYLQLRPDGPDSAQATLKLLVSTFTDSYKTEPLISIDPEGDPGRLSAVDDYLTRRANNQTQPKALLLKTAYLLRSALHDNKKTVSHRDFSLAKSVVAQLERQFARHPASTQARRWLNVAQGMGG